MAKHTPEPISNHASRYNLLVEPLLGIEHESGTRSRVTLPGLLERLSRGEPVELTAIEAHQQHASHAFLVQLAALALARAGEWEVARDEGTWRKLLLDAAAKDGAGAEAFTLVVADLSKPAFLQPPVPEGSLAVLKNEHVRPSEELDVLITAKNHDVKVHRVDAPTPEQWFFALLMLQTMQGFLGAGNYGIARMNGGFSSRPCVAFATGQGASERFVRDVRALLGARNELAKRYAKKKAPLGLVWCAPWDGKSSLHFDELDPFFIEVCRRVRLTIKDGNVVAFRGSSKAARVDGSEATGNTGDAWTPVARKDGKALTLPEAGFTYARVRGFLFPEEDWTLGAAGEVGKDDRYFVGQALVRGQGKTGGYHERWVPIPPRVRSFFAKPETRAALGRRADEGVKIAETVRLKVLKPALLTLLQGGPEKLKFDDDRGEPFLQRFERAVDRDFFTLIFDHAESSPEDADAAFETAVAKLARAELEQAFSSVPLSSVRRLRAISQAERTFEGAKHNQLKRGFPPKSQGEVA